MDPVSAALPQNPRRIFVATLLGVSITDEVIPENNEIFSSMFSTLMLTSEALDDINDIDTNVTISCESTGNDFGPSVSSSTNLNIECRFFFSFLSSVEFHQQEILLDSPQNMNVSVENLEIEEDEEMESILCWAEAFPGPSYYWTLNNEVLVGLMTHGHSKNGDGIPIFIL